MVTVATVMEQWIGGCCQVLRLTLGWIPTVEVDILYLTIVLECEHRIAVIVTGYVVNTLQHYLETDTLVVGTQCQGVSILWNIAVTDESLVTVVDEAIVIHILVFQVTHLHVSVC